ncbi:MAG: hypothetical protein QOJ54_1532 [Aliidongia sp.]|nr:hypothetical protein [Aliidongia sp.]
MNAGTALGLVHKSEMGFTNTESSARFLVASSLSFTTLHNLSAYAFWSGGRSYTVDEMARLMAEAGFTAIKPTILPAGATTLIEGTRG